MSSLWDREHGVEVCAGRSNLPLVIRDSSDTWSHGVDAFRDEIGFFHANGHIEVIEQGPVRAAIQVRSRFGDSTIVQDVRLYAGLRRVEVEIVLDWHEKHRMLKVSFPTRIEDPVGTYEIPYGTLVRPTHGEEEPGQRWMDVTGTIRDTQGAEMPYGVGLLNDSKYGFDIKDSELRMTVLRSPIYAFHGPRKVEPGVVYVYTDQGKQMVRYAVLPHRGDWRDGDIVRAGHAFNHPFIVVRTEPHPGDWTPEGSFLQIDPENVVGTVLKKAEDSDDLILRFYETAGRDTMARVRLPLHGFSFETRLGHHEIKTLKLGMGPEGPSCCEVNMLERDERK